MTRRCPSTPLGSRPGPQVPGWLLASVLVACSARESPSPAPSSREVSPQAQTPMVPAPEEVPRARPVTHLTTHDPAALRGLELGQLSSLELSLSLEDTTARLAAQLPDPPEDACAQLDLLALAPRLPALRTLRVAGCEDAVRAGLGELSAQLTTLQLTDMVLDPVLAGRIASVRTLETLELTRVSVRDVEAVRAALASASFRVLHVEEGSAHVLNAVRGMYEPVSELRLEGRWLGPDVLSALSRMRHLRIVRLSQTEISNYGLSFLRNLPGLEALHLDEETVNNQSPMYLRGLPLRSLSCRCPGLGDVGARHLRQLNALERLRLEDTALTNEGVTSLGQLSALTDIVLAGADVADVGLRALTVLPGLRRLDLRSASLDDADLRPLAEATSLRALTLRGPGVKDPTLRIIADLEQLESLDLEGTQVSDLGLRHLRSLSGLRHLNLRGTRVSQRGFESLQRLTSLTSLDLGDTDVVDAAIRQIAAVASLEELRLDGTLVTAEGLRPLRELPRLQLVDLRNTRVDPSDGRDALPGVKLAPPS